jgi:hypothetical protein
MVTLHFIQGFFQVVFERIYAVENTVVKFLFPQFVPDMLDGVDTPL